MTARSYSWCNRANMGSRVQVEEETNLDVLDAEEDGDGEGEDDKEL